MSELENEFYGRKSQLIIDRLTALQLCPFSFKSVVPYYYTSQFKTVFFTKTKFSDGYGINVIKIPHKGEFFEIFAPVGFYDGPFQATIADLSNTYILVGINRVLESDLGLSALKAHFNNADILRRSADAILDFSQTTNRPEILHSQDLLQHIQEFPIN